MLIKKKADILFFLEQFPSQWDGTKHYITLPLAHNGTLTLMKYPNGTFTYHRKSDVLFDLTEIPIEGGQLNKLVWDNRKGINQLCK